MMMSGDPAVPMAALFHGRDKYCESLGCAIDDLGGDALDAIAAAIEGAAPDIRKAECDRVCSAVGAEISRLQRTGFLTAGALSALQVLIGSLQRSAA